MNVLDRTPPKADHRLPYGSLPLQFGDLRLPKLAPGARAPVMVMIHGGWWQNAYDLAYFGFACEALRAAGVATWSVEYRRVGDAGGGWPGTMADVAAGFEHVAELAKTYPLDVKRVAAAGHSAGGHLAFWLAGRRHIPAGSPLHEPAPKLMPKAVVGLAGAVDLRLCVELGGTFRFTNARPSAESLVGGSPAEVPDRYRAANPGELLPFGVPQVLLQGTQDQQIPPELPVRWTEAAKRQGDSVRLEILPGADHFDVVDPESKAWPAVMKALLEAAS